MSNRITSHIRDETASADYISATVFIFVAVILISVILDVYSIIAVKQQLDSTTDQVVRQIQLTGKTDDVTETLIIESMTTARKAENITYKIDTAYMTNKDGCTTAIQLGTPFFVTLTADVTLGGFWRLAGKPITLSSTASGVSERYWK